MSRKTQAQIQADILAPLEDCFVVDAGGTGHGYYVCRLSGEEIAGVKTILQTHHFERMAQLEAHLKGRWDRQKEQK